VAGTFRSATINGLAKGSSYYFHIRTNLAIGSSAYTTPELLVITP
jgi:hypothetical protein